MLVISFNALDVRNAKRAAFNRNEFKRLRGIKSSRFSTKHTDQSAHVYGVLAEMAVAFYLGTKIDETILPFGDRGAPDLYHRGFSYEVKYTSLSGGDFIIPNSDPSYMQADRGVLVTPGPSKRFFCLVGWISKEDFLDLYQHRDYGAGPRCSVTSDQLEDMVTLKTASLSLLRA